MNIKFDHTNHKKLWNWMAKNPNKNKEDWPDWYKNGGSVKRAVSICFACDYVEHNCLSCYECPIDWPISGYGMRVCSNSLFGMWGLAPFGSHLASELASQIANLPVKDGVETI